jgi:predicted dehydrogenase
MIESKTPTTRWPKSIAIAGAWGYIGRKFVDAALQLGVTPNVFDPGPIPEGLPADRVKRFTDEESFYRQPADFFHLALPPQARRRALDVLLPRSRNEPIAILNEKPMASPEHPDHCRQLIEAVEQNGTLMLFDFLELFSPLTEAIVGYLSQFKQATIHSIEMDRMKDREDPANLRNHKVMVPIQYQESVHCMAWILYLLARIRGGWREALADGVRIAAAAEPYVAPNPESYPYIVDGRCIWQIDWGKTRTTGRTDFKRNAPWTKRRKVRGEADGRQFEIDAEFLEGHKRLLIDGIDQQIDPKADSYVDVIQTFARWRDTVDQPRLMHEVYPNPTAALICYQLSSALWRASYDRKSLAFRSCDELLAFDARFAAEVPKFQRYK